MANYHLLEDVVSVDDFMRLRSIAGMSIRPEKAAAIGLANSLYGVRVVHGNEIVGMGRVVGDGGLNFDLVDIAVDPNHQGAGVGKMIITSLMNYIHETAHTGAYVTLMADVPGLYKKFGFKLSSPATEGMHFEWNNGEIGD